MSELRDFYDCAFWIKLEHSECWEGAVFFATADRRSKHYWRKRVNMPRLGRLPTAANGQALAAALTPLFQRTEGRGDFCVVEQYRRGEREYYFAYPQDHKETSMEFRGGEMIKQPRNPVFEIIFVHNDEQQTLSIWHDGPKERVRDLQVAFAKAVLGQDIRRDSPRDDRAYDLEPFLNPDFTFTPAPVLGIKSVEVRKLRVRVFGEGGCTIRIDLANEAASHVLYDKLVSALVGVPQTQRRVSLVGLRATFEPQPGERQARTHSFELVWPSSCSLANDHRGTVLQRMLQDHRIEPRRSQEPDDGGNGAN